MSQAKHLVLFDIDGTLLRGAGPHHRDALIEGIRVVTGIDTDFTGIETAGTLDGDLIRALLLAKGCGDAEILRIAEECQAAYGRNCSHDLSPFVCRGARDLLAQLKERGAAMGLVTGNFSRIGWRKMELTGLSGFFSFGAFAEDGSSRAAIAKVAIQRAMKSGFVIDGCVTTLIGDHRNDVEAAKANGIRSVAVASGPMPAAELRLLNPDFLVDNLAELDVDELLK